MARLWFGKISTTTQAETPQTPSAGSRLEGQAGHFFGSRKGASPGTGLGHRARAPLQTPKAQTGEPTKILQEGGGVAGSSHRVGVGWGG